jgi:hypothetical protein
VNAREPILGVVFGITEKCYGLPKFSQFNVHFLQSGFGHIYDLLASVGNCGFFKIEQNLVDKGKTCVGVDFYVGGDLRQVVMVPRSAISALTWPSLLLHSWKR